jgi:hypothetical protein
LFECVYIKKIKKYYFNIFLKTTTTLLYKACVRLDFYFINIDIWISLRVLRLIQWLIEYPTSLVSKYSTTKITNVHTKNQTREGVKKALPVTTEPDSKLRFGPFCLFSCSSELWNWNLYISRPWRQVWKPTSPGQLFHQSLLLVFV